MTMNSNLITAYLQRNVQRSQMSLFSAFTLKTDRFQKASFSNSCVFIHESVFEKLVFTAEQCERKAKTGKFHSVFI